MLSVQASSKQHAGRTFTFRVRVQHRPSNALWGELPNAYAIDAGLPVCCMAPSRPHLYRSLTFICRQLPQLPISIPSAMLSVGLIQPRGIPPRAVAA